MFVATLLINHFDLFGLRQVALYLVRKPYTYLEFRTPLFYRYVRHPLYVGWLIAFWATPTMTGAHLLFAVLTSAYILTAIRWEERDLVIVHGSKYQDYQKQRAETNPIAGSIPCSRRADRSGPELGGITSHKLKRAARAALFVFDTAAALLTKRSSLVLLPWLPPASP